LASTPARFDFGTVAFRLCHFSFQSTGTRPILTPNFFASRFFFEDEIAAFLGNKVDQPIPSNLTILPLRARFLRLNP
jgi:hypothetical protein